MSAKGWRVSLCVVTARCDRGWTEHLHHLIYDPLRHDQPGTTGPCTHTRAAPMCRHWTHLTDISAYMDVRGNSYTLMQRQNKFAYACDRVRTELREGKRVDGWGGNSDGIYPRARTRNGTHIGVQPLESNVTKRGGRAAGALVIMRLGNKGNGRSDNGAEKVTRLL